MHVRVVRTHENPSGTVTAKHVLDSKQEIVGIFLEFHLHDVNEADLTELGEAFTVEAQQWTEDPPGIEKRTPPKIQVVRLPQLPSNARVLIDDDPEHVLIIFHEDAVSEAGALGYQRFLLGRTATWSRKQKGC